MKRWLEVAAGLGVVLAAASTFADQQQQPTKASAPMEQSQLHTAGGWPNAGPNECVSSEAKKSLNYCPAGAISRRTNRKTGAAFLQTDVNPGKEKKAPDRPVEISIPRPSPELSKK